MKDLKELTSLIELVSVNNGSSHYAQLEEGDFVLVLGRMPYSTNTFCKVLSNFGSKQGDIISVKPSDIRCKVTLDDVLKEILPAEKKEKKEEKPNYKKGDIVELKDDYSAIYILGHVKNSGVFHTMKCSATRVEGVGTISVSKCEVPIHAIKCIANGKRINDMRKALTSVIGLL